MEALATGTSGPSPEPFRRSGVFWKGRQGSLFLRSQAQLYWPWTGALAADSTKAAQIFSIRRRPDFINSEISFTFPGVEIKPSMSPIANAFALIILSSADSRKEGIARDVPARSTIRDLPSFRTAA